MAAVLAGNIDVSELLLDNKADVNSEDELGMTVLMAAVQLGRSEMANLLLNYNADVNAKDKGGSTALMYAAGNMDIFNMLVAKGADICAVNNQGITVLMNTVLGGNVEIVRGLLGKGPILMQNQMLGLLP